MKNKFINNPAIAIVMVFLSIIILLGFIGFLGWKQSSRLSEGAYLGIWNFSGLSVAAAEVKLNNIINNIEEQGVNFTYNNQEINIPAKVVAFDPELSYEIFAFDQEKNLEILLNNYGRYSWLKLFTWPITKKSKSQAAAFRFNEERFKQFLKNTLNDLEKPASNAYFSFNDDQKLIIISEETGLKIDYEANGQLVKKTLASLNNQPWELIIQEVEPLILQQDLLPIINEAGDLIAEKDFKLVYKDNSWSISNQEIITWLGVSQNNPKKVILDADKVKTYLESTLAPEIDRPAAAPSFTIENDKIENWQPGKSGRELLIEDSLENILNTLLDTQTAELLVKEDMGEEAAGLAQEIREIVGTGQSNFAGSPANRRHNIKVGAETFHGLLIAPQEEFSVVENLGEINAASGYLPELVIKDNRTIPEYGGGLCQVSTTLFRAALASGLPITARQNHSYRVSYYEPAGTDATIYNPSPDLKFVNDSDYHILIQARIENNDLYFDFWSTNDGRQVEITDPIIYNIVSPPPTKIIMTTELAPGVKKCTERAHNGASAYFDYSVNYPDGEEPVVNRFNSYYVPWQEVCLMGATPEPDGEEETSEESLIELEETTPESE